MAIGLVGFGVAALFILIGYFSSASTRDHQRSYGKDEILAEHVQALLERVETLESQLADNSDGGT